MRNIIKKFVSVCALADLGVCRPQQSGDLETRFGSQDPEIWMNATQIIQCWGYTAESYNVTTSDGYILNIQRIPYGKGQEGQNYIRPVVFLQHGLESSSTNWITNLPSQSAAYLFADAGFDVWLGNVRGNTYGQNHVNLTTADRIFWNLRKQPYDLPAMINYVLRVTNQRQLYYIGHVQGSMMGFAAFSQDQQLASYQGAESHQMNQTRMPVYLSHTPAGTSTQNIVHFGQMVNIGLFGKYDYGKKGNQQHYGTDKPPVYDLTQMKVPVSLYWGDIDALADLEDVTNSLIPYLPNIAHNEEVAGFNHYDFTLGLRAPTVIYHPILNDITRMEKDSIKCL